MSRRPEAGEIARWRELTERALEAARAGDWPRVAALDAERSLALRSEPAPTPGASTGLAIDTGELERRGRELIELDAELLRTVGAARTVAASRLGADRALRRASREYGAAASLGGATDPFSNSPYPMGTSGTAIAASAAGTPESGTSG